MTTKKRITLEDVSRTAGVSLTTASMILSGRPDVSFSPETVQNVRHTADVLGYRAPVRRRSRPLSSRKLVLIVSPNVGNAYYANMVQAIQQSAEQHGVSTLIFTTYRDAEKEKEILDMALDVRSLCGFFLMFLHHARHGVLHLMPESLSERLPIIHRCHGTSPPPAG